MRRPTLLPAAAQAETFAGLTYHVDGELVPVLTVDIEPPQAIYFEHHILLWKNPTVTLGLKPMKRALSRMIAGVQIFVIEASGRGQIAVSRDGVGRVVPLRLRAGQEIQVREQQFLAATQNVEYASERVPGAADPLSEGSGLVIDRFKGTHGDGILWVHGYGNVFEIDLPSGASIEVEPCGWLYKDVGVKLETNVQRLTNGPFGGLNLITQRFTGPGKVGLQSMSLQVPAAD